MEILRILRIIIATLSFVALTAALPHGGYSKEELKLLGSSPWMRFFSLDAPKYMDDWKRAMESPDPMKTAMEILGEEEKEVAAASKPKKEVVISPKVAPKSVDKPRKSKDLIHTLTRVYYPHPHQDVLEWALRLWSTVQNIRNSESLDEVSKLRVEDMDNRADVSTNEKKGNIRILSADRSLMDDASNLQVHYQWL